MNISEQIKTIVSQHVRGMNGLHMTFDNDGRICCPNCGCASLHFSAPMQRYPVEKYMIVQFKVECEVYHTDHPFIPPFVMELSSGKGQTFLQWERFR